MESPFKLTPAITEGVVHLFTTYPPMAYRDTLIDIYLGYLSHEHGHLPVNFDSMGHQMYLLLEFLRVAALENGENGKDKGWEK
ncbi:MAG TPA: hypothetical protein VIU12_01305 [Chryseolinea sp.]